MAIYRDGHVGAHAAGSPPARYGKGALLEPPQNRSDAACTVCVYTEPGGKGS